MISFANKPTILYNNPRRTGFDITIDTYLTLLKDDWVIGIKEAGDPAHLPELLAKIEKPLKVYMGGESAVTEKLAFRIQCYFFYCWKYLSHRNQAMVY